MESSCVVLSDVAIIWEFVSEEVAVPHRWVLSSGFTPFQVETLKELSEGGTNGETWDLLVRSVHCVNEAWWLCTLAALPLG